MRELYALAARRSGPRSRVGEPLRDSPRSMLSSSVQKMELLVGFLRRLRVMTDEHAGKFGSEGCTRFFAMIAEELDKDYFALIEGYLKELKFKGGADQRAFDGRQQGDRVHATSGPRPGFHRATARSFRLQLLSPRTRRGRLQGAGELEGRGLNLVANALMQSVDHVHSFFIMLMTEIGFYVGLRECAANGWPEGRAHHVPKDGLTRSRRCPPRACMTCA